MLPGAQVLQEFITRPVRKGEYTVQRRQIWFYCERRELRIVKLRLLAGVTYALTHAPPPTACTCRRHVSYSALILGLIATELTLFDTMPHTQRTPPNNLQVQEHLPHYVSDPVLNRDTLITDQEELANITKRYKRRLELTPGTSDLSVEHKIEQLHASQENRFDILTKALTTLIEQNSVIKKSLECMATKYYHLLTKVDTLEKENTIHKLLEK